MPDFHADNLIPMGSFNHFDGGSAGTDGCGVCVGLVLVRPNDQRRWCAHFCVNQPVGNPEARLAVKNRVLQILRNNVAQIAPPGVQWMCCSDSFVVSGRNDTGAIVSAIMEYFSNLAIDQENNPRAAYPPNNCVVGTGVYVNAAGAFGHVNGNSHVLGPEVANNHLAEINI